MNSRQRLTLQALFGEPTPHVTRWTDIESLLRALGTVKAGSGSRIHVLVNGRPATFHMPHPGNEVRTKTIRDVRDFLAAAGVGPE